MGEAGGGAEVRFAGVSKRFAGAGGAALERLTLEVARGEFMVLIGPSGCGKSTTLRLLAGLEAPDEGEIAIGGRAVNRVAPQDRDVAMVFQGYALYPHWSVRDNLAFPLKMRKVPPAERERLVGETAASLGLSALLGRRPDELSGGERQRVAMGRALVRKPRVFLFDEPLSNLDAALRAGIRAEIGALVRRVGATALYVTHDHTEAMTLADRIAVLRAGRLLQVGTPRAIYEAPATSFVAGFVGAPRINLIEAEARGSSLVAGPFCLPIEGRGLPSRLELGVRPEHVRLGEGEALARVVALEPLGAETHVALDAGGVALRARAPGFASYRVGDSVPVRLDARDVHLFDPANDGRRVEAPS